MTNNFSTIKNKLKSEKFILVRINPVRQVINDLTLVGGTEYSMTFNYPISNVKVDGSSFTRNDLTALSINQYSYNEATGLFKIRFNNTISNFTAVIVGYYLFYSNDYTKQAHENPEDTSTTLRSWEGRVLGYPEFEVTQQDIIDSVLSIGNTSLTIINEDSDFQKYLTDNDSFANREVKIWQCLNKTSNIKKFFFGIVDEISIDSNVIISVDNAFSLLNKKVYSGTAYFNSIFNSTDYPNLKVDKLNTPITKVLSFVSKTTNLNFNERLASSGPDQLIETVESGLQLINNSYNANKSPTNNNVWVACKASSVSSNYTYTLDNVVAVLPNRSYIAGVGDNSYFRVGDTLAINGNGGYYVEAIFYGTTNKIMINSLGGSVTAISNGDVCIRPAIPFVQLNDINQADQRHTPSYLKHYTLTKDSNDVYVITFLTSFTNIISGITPDCKTYYRVYNHDSLNHSDVIKSLVEGVGLTTDATSFATAALTDLPVRFSIPYEGSTTFESALNIIQDLLTSTLGMLYINNDFEICYSLIDSFTATEEITENEILNKSLKQKIKYSDIKNSIKFINDQGEQLYSYSDTGLTVEDFFDTNLNVIIEDEESKYLHEIDSTKEITSLLSDVTNSKTRLLSVLKNRRLTIDLTTKGINFESILNDDFNIISNKIVGILGQKNIKIFTINKKANETKIVGLDLLGL